MDLLSIGIGLFAGGGASTMVMAALGSHNYDQRYRDGYAAGYDQAKQDEANRAGLGDDWLAQSLQAVQAANRAANIDRAKLRSQVGHLTAQVQELETDKARLSRDNCDLVADNKERRQTCDELDALVHGLLEQRARDMEGKASVATDQAATEARQ